MMKDLKKLQLVSGWATYVIIILLLIALGLLIKNDAFGRIIMIMYGFTALIFGIKSEETFKMVVISLLCSMALTIMKNQELSEHFAQYTFLLLCFGILSAFREVWKSERLR